MKITRGNMSHSKPKESGHLDTHEEYLHLKAVSDKNLQGFARKSDDKKKLIDVSVEAKERAGAVLRSWKHLGQLLKACQNKARHVWLTASEETRTQILQRIMPSIPNPRRPDIAAVCKYQSMDHLHREAYILNRNHYLWPQLNVQVLSKDSSCLIHLLANRSHYQPYEFARVDSRCLRGSRIHSAVILPKLNVFDSNFRMLLLDNESYGRIVVRNNDSDNCEAYKKGGKICFGGAFNISEGLCIMEAQQGVLEFLICYCREVLSGMTQSPNSDITLLQCNLQVHLLEPSWPEIGKDRAFSNFYGAPQMQMPTDFSKLRSMFHVRYTLAMDHVWLLRINPGYLQKNIEGVLRQNESKSPVVVRVIFKAFLSLQKWECLRDLAAEAKRLQKDYEKMPRDYLQAVVAPPKNYFVAVLKLFKVLSYFEEEAFYMLKCGEEESEMTSQFITCWGDILRSGKVKTDGTEHLEMMRYLNNIMTKTRLIHLFDLMDDLEEAAIYESSDGKRISVNGGTLSASLAHFLSDLGLIGIAKYEVWKDWAEQICAATKNQMDMTFEKSLQVEETVVAIDRILFVFKDKLGELGSLANNKFNYPIDAKQTEESTKSLRDAEQALDEFWQYVDKIMFNNGFPGFLKVSGMNMAFWRTPKWQAPKITTHESRVTMPARVVSANNLSATPPEIFAKDTPYVIMVIERAMKVFKAIFRAAQPSIHKTKRVHFEEFIDAMGEAGFRAIKHHMSMWYFQPEGVPLWADPALAHGIMINMPWPDQRISVKYAYELGQRLHRHYSWTLETFTENFNTNTHWIARFDAVEFLRRESVAATQEPGMSFSAVDLRNKQIARFQAQEREYYDERQNQDPIWFGDICCSEMVGPRMDSEVVGNKSEPKKRYPMLLEIGHSKK